MDAAGSWLHRATAIRTDSANKQTTAGGRGQFCNAHKKRTFLEGIRSNGHRNMNPRVLLYMHVPSDVKKVYFLIFFRNLVPMFDISFLDEWRGPRADDVYL